MPPLAAGDVFLVLEFIAGNRRIPHAVLAALLASLPSSSSSSSASLPTSPRLRKALVLRALHDVLHGEDAPCSFTLLRKARAVLADPDAAACLPHHLSSAANEENDGARATAAVADLKRLLDHEWENLPPSKLELAAERLAGDGSLQTWAAADHTKRTKLRQLVGESTAREISAKLMQDASASCPPISDSVPASNKRNLMERHPNASTYEWDGLGYSDDDRPVQKRQLPHFEKKPNSPACAYKMRKKWSEIEEKTLLEGVEKYGKGNWKDIKMAYPHVFEERSTVDLKDKFRNMERHHESDEA